MEDQTRNAGGTMSKEQDTEGGKRPHDTELYVDVPRTRLPIVYHPIYNITFMGMEKLHPFDAGKWGKVVRFLKEEQFVTDENMVPALEASEEDLKVAHTKSYLSSLKWSAIVAGITEIPPLMFLPNCLVQRRVLRPLRTQTGGTIMAGKLAIERGWAINIGGGFHHCSGDEGGGFCAYADITLAIKVRTSPWPSSSSSREWRASPRQPSSTLTPTRETATSETSLEIGACSSWTCTTATSTPGTESPSGRSGGMWSWTGARRTLSTSGRWSSTRRGCSTRCGPTSWSTTRARTSWTETPSEGWPYPHRVSLCGTRLCSGL
ncbi:histone deacetylase 11 isoform X3 [Gadus morhua]|uniref:histone deacetylase 11 isoform X3 n=1 Tax=Gadus morhua TaxID=8049 RepID=UPI0011B4210E|nr:histone deacetylase 11 isoform X3 [Gadus morhua]